MAGYGSTQGFKATELPQLPKPPRGFQELAKALSKEFVRQVCDPTIVESDELTILGMNRSVGENGQHIVRDKLTGKLRMPVLVVGGSLLPGNICNLKRFVSLV